MHIFVKKKKKINEVGMLKVNMLMMMRAWTIKAKAANSTKNFFTKGFAVVLTCLVYFAQFLFLSLIKNPLATHSHVHKHLSIPKQHVLN